VHSLISPFFAVKLYDMEIINESVENYFVNYKIYLKSKKQKKSLLRASLEHSKLHDQNRKFRIGKNKIELGQK
jgi:hypothetical protein